MIGPGGYGWMSTIIIGYTCPTDCIVGGGYAGTTSAMSWWYRPESRCVQPYILSHLFLSKAIIAVLHLISILWVRVHTNRRALLSLQLAANTEAAKWLQQLL